MSDKMQYMYFLLYSTVEYSNHTNPERIKLTKRNTPTHTHTHTCTRKGNKKEEASLSPVEYYIVVIVNNAVNNPRPSRHLGSQKERRLDYSLIPIRPGIKKNNSFPSTHSRSPNSNQNTSLAFTKAAPSIGTGLVFQLSPPEPDSSKHNPKHCPDEPYASQRLSLDIMPFCSHRYRIDRPKTFQTSSVKTC